MEAYTVCSLPGHRKIPPCRTARETTGRVLRDSLPRNLSWLHFPSLCHTYLSQYSQPLYITVHCHLQPNPVHARSWLHNPSSHLQVQSPACSKRRQPWIVQCKTITSLSRLCCQGVLLQEKEETCKQKHIFSPLLFHCSRQVVPLPHRGDPNAPPRFSPEICGVVTQTLTLTPHGQKSPPWSPAQVGVPLHCNDPRQEDDDDTRTRKAAGRIPCPADHSRRGAARRRRLGWPGRARPVGPAGRRSAMGQQPAPPRTAPPHGARAAGSSAWTTLGKRRETGEAGPHPRATASHARHRARSHSQRVPPPLLGKWGHAVWRLGAEAAKGTVLRGIRVHPSRELRRRCCLSR